MPPKGKPGDKPVDKSEGDKHPPEEPTQQMSNLRRYFKDENMEIMELFMNAEIAEEWHNLWLMCDEALLVPSLPRWYRIQYHIVRAWGDEGAATHLRCARQLLDEIRQMWADDPNGLPAGYIRERLASITSMLETTEDAVAHAAAQRELSAMTTQADSTTSAATSDLNRPGTPAILTPQSTSKRDSITVDKVESSPTKITDAGTTSKDIWSPPGSGDESDGAYKKS